MTTEKTTDLTLWTFDSKVTSLPFNRLSRFFFFSIRVFSSESVLHIRWPKYWSFSSNISWSNEYSWLIPFRIDWFDLLAVQGTLRVFSSTTVWKYQFFGAQPSLWSNSHICTWLLEKTQLWLDRPLSAKEYLCFLICCLVLSQCFFFYSMKRQSPAKCALSHRILSPSVRWVSWLDPPSPSFIFNILIISNF